MRPFHHFFAIFFIAFFSLFSNLVFAQGASETTVSDQAKALVEVLKSDEARQGLITELEKIAGETPSEEPKSDESAQSNSGEAETTAKTGENQVSFGRQLANITKESSEAFAASLQTLSSRLTSTADTLGSLGTGETTGLLWEALTQLGLIIIATYAVFYTLRILSLPIHRYLGTKSAEGGNIQTIATATVSLIIDIAVVIAAWSLGYIIAIYILGTGGQIGIRQTLYLNAFLVVELTRVFIRLVLSPSTAKLRWIDISDKAAKYTVRMLTAIVSVVGYGHLLVLPIVNLNISNNAGAAVAILVAITALLVSLYLVLKNKKSVANWLADDEDVETKNTFIHNLASHWHYPVLIYLGVLFVIVITRPDGILFPFLSATAKIIVAILVGGLIATAISKTMAGGVHVPAKLNERLPLLEPRLNRFVPTLLTVAKAIVFFIIAMIVSDVIGLLDISGWLSTQVGAQAAASIISTMFILAFAFVVWVAMSSWIDYRLNPGNGLQASSREITLLSLFRNAGTIAIVIITLMFALSELGIDIAPLIASAGVLGLAIGFGAQKLVQDIITGIFIQFENAINVGDVITLNGTTGTVERLTIRSVSLRDVEGAYHIIPFSSVDMVTNYMREFAFFKCDMGVAYRENTDEVRDAMMEAFDILKQDTDHKPNILEDMHWMGVQSFGDNAVVCRIRIKTTPGTQWALGRAYNDIVKKIFDERGIEMPFPHRTIYFGEDKNGNAPSAPITIESAPKTTK